jgi:hypothetical protein
MAHGTGPARGGDLQQGRWLPHTASGGGTTNSRSAASHRRAPCHSATPCHVIPVRIEACPHIGACWTARPPNRCALDGTGTSKDAELEKLQKRLQFVMYCIDCFVS